MTVFARPRGPRRGMALIPSIFTVGNLFCGFWSIIRSRQDDLALAAALIGVAIVLDLLDGHIARLTGTVSEFGGELDSLADIISFGVAPALLAYSWGVWMMPRTGWLVAFLFVMCAALRLARFNVQRQVVDGRFFVGLPVPAAAGLVAALVNFTPEPLTERAEGIPIVVLLAGLSFLMVSTLRYRSFKSLDLRTRRSYLTGLGIALLFLVIASHPEHSLLLLAGTYWLSGPLLYLWARVRRRPVESPNPATTTAKDPA